MNRFDFNQLGGMPFDQDTLDWLQTDYLAAFRALGSLCGSDNQPVTISGIELTSGTWNAGTVSSGWLFHPNYGLVPFEGGSFDASTKGLFIGTDSFLLNYEIGSHYSKQRVVARIIAGTGNSLRDLSERRFAPQMGNANRTAWIDLPFVGEAVGDAAKLRIDNISRMVHIHGRCSLAYKPAAHPNKFTTVLKNIPAADPVGFQNFYFAVGFLSGFGGDYAYETITENPNTIQLERTGGFGRLLPANIGNGVIAIDGPRLQLPLLPYSIYNFTSAYTVVFSLSYHF